MQAQLDEETANTATYLAMCVRNAMEEIHGGENRLGDEGLTDRQMAAINPIVRNAIATGLHALAHIEEPAARRFVDFQAMLVPDYWERPELRVEYVELVEHHRG